MVVLLFVGIKVGIKEPVSDYISKDGTLAVKGFFVLFIVFCHAAGYKNFNISSPADYLMCKAIVGLGQLPVVAFLFYSGYGIMLSVMNKKDYARGLLKKRFLPLLIKFDFAVVMFLLCDLLIGERYSVGTVLSSFIAWESVGNSSWYIFATFVMYFICAAVFVPLKNRYKTGAAAVTVLTVVYIIAMVLVGKPLRWYDTIIVFPLGMWFAHFKGAFDRVTEKFSRWVALLAAFAAMFAVTWYLSKSIEFFHILKSIFFALTLVTLTRRFSPRNKILTFFGRHVFSFFILQRIPMMLIYHYYPEINVYLFVAISLAVTCPLGLIFDRFIRPEKLFNREKKAVKAE